MAFLAAQEAEPNDNAIDAELGRLRWDQKQYAQAIQVWFWQTGARHLFSSSLNSLLNPPTNSTLKSTAAKTRSSRLA